MSKKFEQLMDLVVNEEMEKANELFHDLVVEMSREIYENMIAEDADVESEVEDEEMDEAAEVDATSDDEHDDEHDGGMFGGDAADDLESDIEVSHDDEDGEDAETDDESTDDRIEDLEDAMSQLKAEFEALLADEKDEPEHDDMFGSDDEHGEEAGEKTKEEFSFESRQITREYRDVVPDPRKKSEDGSTNAKSPVSSAKGRPSSDAKANNIAQGGKGADPKPGVGGVLKKGGDFVKPGTANVGGAPTKGYTQKTPAHGADKKGKGEQGGVNDKSVVG